MAERESKIFRISRQGEYITALVGLEFLAGLTMGVVGILSRNTNFDLGAAALVGSATIKASLIGHEFIKASREFHAND